MMGGLALSGEMSSRQLSKVTQVWYMAKAMSRRLVIIEHIKKGPRQPEGRRAC